MEISRVEPLTVNKVYKVLGATHISAAQKEQFLRVNSVEINSLFSAMINSRSFEKIMHDRPLIIFKPLKNSYTKIGDKKILAEQLGIKPSEVGDYIRNISECIKTHNTDNIPKDKLEMAKTYAYRHGTKDEVVNFLDYELSTAGDILGTLYRTLSYNTGGAADYFVRPIHVMNNKTLINLYSIVDKNLKNAKSVGNISEEAKEQTAEWAIVRIYEIQNNQKLKNALKLKQQLS